MRKNLLDAQTEDCRMCTVSDLIRDHALARIDLLKIDVEGAELDVLRGIAPEHWALIRQVRTHWLRCASASTGLSVRGGTHRSAKMFPGLCLDSLALPQKRRW